MELTIEQVLQQGVAAHKEGKLEEAERLYRIVLQSQPAHPDANHNLALIAVSVNKVQAALPLFKSALEANPNIEQFWLSYIGALIKEKQFEAAKTVFLEARQKGFVGEQINAIQNQLQQLSVSSKPFDKKKNLTLKEKRQKVSEGKQKKKMVQNNTTNNSSPSQSQANKLIELYQNGQYEEAEKLARSFTQQFPNHQFGWKILGGVLGQTDRLTESLKAKKKAVELVPKDPEANYNLGNALKDLGRLDEAEISFRKAITIKPDFAVHHGNLGVTLQELGRLEEAEACYVKAIALKPDYPEAYRNLGKVLQELGRLEEAEPNYRQAIALKPIYPEAYTNLAATLEELGAFKEAELNYKQALDFKPDYAPARYKLGVLLFGKGEYSIAKEQFELTNILLSKLYALRCSYLGDEETIFYTKLDLQIKQGEINAVIGSLIFCAENKYGIKRSNPFCNDPLSYVVKTDLNQQYDFENIFIKTARDVLMDNSVSRKQQTLLTNGIQTSGNIFVLDKVLKTKIERVIHAEIEKYRIQFKDSEEGFIKNWPASYKISGWLVSMKSGGKLDSHMHDSGWITGSIYINVPPKSKPDSGSIVLCLNDKEHIIGLEKTQDSIIDVVTGSLCLFPSSLHHYTIPFEAKENRVVLAFDVIPIW